jgi:uncharacterized protein YndB with AHSA1/START domain
MNAKDLVITRTFDAPSARRVTTKKILIALAVVVVAFAAVVALQPAEFRIARTARIAAPPADVFAHVNDPKKMQAWSPFAKLDPAAQNRFEGPAAGVGAAMSWSGNRDVGEGRMTIVESRPGELVRMRLDITKPFAGTSYAEFTFRPDGAGTSVTWSLTGRNGFLARAFCLFADMDKMVGGSFEQGLAALKALTEKAS